MLAAPRLRQRGAVGGPAACSSPRVLAGLEKSIGTVVKIPKNGEGSLAGLCVGDLLRAWHGVCGGFLACLCVWGSLAGLQGFARDLLRACDHQPHWIFLGLAVRQHVALSLRPGRRRKAAAPARHLAPLRPISPPQACAGGDPVQHARAPRCLDDAIVVSRV